MRSARTLASLGAAFLFAACSRSHGPVKIGLAGPFSEPRGVSMLHGAQLAVNQINARGGIRGRAVELRVVDDSASEDGAVRSAQALYDDADVVAVVGHLTSGASIAAAQVYGGGPHPVVMISPSASSPDLSGLSPYVFRLCPSDLAYGAALARLTRQGMGARRAGIIFASDDYGRGVRRTFAADFAKLGGTVVEEDPYIPAVYSFEPYLERMRRAGIDLLVLATERSAAEMALRELHALKVPWRVVGGDALAGIEAAGALAENVRLPAAYLADAPGERNAAFVAQYSRAHPGEQPDHRGAAAYDAVNLIARAVQAHGTDRRAIRDYIAQVGHRVPALEGVTGAIRFDSAGDAPSKNVVIGVVRRGRLVTDVTP
jgi:branched-chain amino acid transport system substrate-binding protein